MRCHLIETQTALEALFEKLGSTHVIALDTEFLRIRTYYPKLCLLQVASQGDVFCIDPLAVDLDIDLIRDILLDVERTKVFHAGRQDIEVIYAHCGIVPQKLFDTQIAAAMLGLGDQIGYADLVEIVTGKSLPKAHTRTDWCKRPLSPEQIEYAADDVCYLESIYQFLTTKLEKSGRLKWVFEECKAMSAPTLYETDPASAYKRLGQGQRLEPVAQGILKELANWRERTSQSRDLPRNWVVKDDVLATIAREQPESLANLAALEGVSKTFVKRYGSKVLNLIKDVLRADHHPIIWSKGMPLDADQRALRKQIMAYLQSVSKETGISISLLGSRQDVERLVRGRKDVNLLTGWRADLIGDELAQILT